jgi:K+-transporting ATPase KdpF subunit
MIFDYSLAALVAAGLLCYLLYALLRPERFSAEIAGPWIWFRQACQHSHACVAHGAAAIR